MAPSLSASVHGSRREHRARHALHFEDSQVDPIYALQVNFACCRGRLTVAPEVAGHQLGQILSTRYEKVGGRHQQRTRCAINRVLHVQSSTPGAQRSISCCQMMSLLIDLAPSSNAVQLAFVQYKKVNVGQPVGPSSTTH